MRTLLALTVSAALLAPTPAVAAERAAPTLVLSVAEPYRPVLVPPVASGATALVQVNLRATEPVSDVVVQAESDDGALAIADPEQQLGPVAGSVTVSFRVAGAAPGVHELWVSAWAPSAQPGSTVVRYVVTAGSPQPPNLQHVYQRTFAWQSTQQLAGLESPTRAVRMVSFVSRTFAYLGLPPRGRPTCTQEGGGCVRYGVDPVTRLLYVGTDVVGTLEDAAGLYTDGLVPPDASSGEVYGRELLIGNFGFGAFRPEGTWRYRSPDHPVGLTYQKVTFRDDGSYRLAFAYDGRRVKRFSGTYRQSRYGAITFRSGGKVVQRGTILSRQRLPPRYGPYPKAIFLVLSGRHGRNPDGNLLTQVR